MREREREREREEPNYLNIQIIGTHFKRIGQIFSGYGNNFTKR